MSRSVSDRARRLVLAVHAERANGARVADAVRAVGWTLGPYYNARSGMGLSKPVLSEEQLVAAYARATEVGIDAAAAEVGYSRQGLWKSFRARGWGRPRSRSAAVSDGMRKRWASLTTDEKRAAAARLHAALTPEQRSERARRASLSRTPERRTEAARKAVAVRQARRHDRRLEAIVESAPESRRWLVRLAIQAAREVVAELAAERIALERTA